ncbi:hypothetical protein SAMN02745866_00735 [Alteromonadaceae bacterium Bs31]|nr:hypothetical protein SAMN02745866_00735 [Alteromonadaceae bacterium Bs31]
MMPNLQLPWSSTIEDDKRFWRIVGILLIPFFILSIVIPMIHVPEPERSELEELPPQLAKVVIEQQELPKPTPVPTPVPTPEPEEEPEEEPEQEEKPKEEPTPEPKPDLTPEPVSTPEPAKLVEKAREEAQAEINQFADALSDMRDSFDLSEVNEELTQSTGEAAEIDRSIIGAKAKSGSGGIKTSELSRNTGGVALSGKKTTAVDSKLAAPTGASAEAQKKAAATGGRRSEEQMRKIMDQNKGAMFNIYNRALRKDPTLEGKVVFEMVIEPGGRISSAKIVSSDLDDPALEAKLLSRIKLINFGKQDVKQTRLIFSFDFLPY